MITLAERHAEIPSCPFECIAVASPWKCIVDDRTPTIPSLELSWNTQLLNVADDKPHTTAPNSLLANSQRVATTVVSEEEYGILNA